jgi:hypothetical protein
MARSARRFITCYFQVKWAGTKGSLAIQAGIYAFAVLQISSNWFRVLVGKLHFHSRLAREKERKGREGTEG